MARRPRLDAPGAWFHVMNRGIARRVVFPDEFHVRMFLAILACAVRRGEIEVHVFCIMPTHFHLLVRSQCGKLSEALRRVQNEYVRWYNRRARRDGALFRGRFLSRPVLSERYHDVLVRYIEHNPVEARIVKRPEHYAHGSASRQACGRRPPWLSAGWVDECLRRARLVDSEASYVSLWCRRSTASERALVEARLRRPASPRDDLDDLIGAAPARVQRWMAQKARLADGGWAREPLVAADSVRRVVARERTRRGTWTRSGRRGPALDLWAVARIGLLVDLAGMTHDEIAAHLQVTTTLVGRQRTRHRGLLADADYASRVADLAVQCLAQTHSQPRAETSEHALRRIAAPRPSGLDGPLDETC